MRAASTKPISVRLGRIWPASEGNLIRCWRRAGSASSCWSSPPPPPRPPPLLFLLLLIIIIIRHRSEWTKLHSTTMLENQKRDGVLRTPLGGGGSGTGRGKSNAGSERARKNERERMRDRRERERETSLRVEAHKEQQPRRRPQQQFSFLVLQLSVQLVGRTSEFCLQAQQQQQPATPAAAASEQTSGVYRPTGGVRLLDCQEWSELPLGPFVCACVPDGPNRVVGIYKQTRHAL